MGRFITIEGGEFTGKTSVVTPGLKKSLQKLGYTVLVSREPGGTPHGEMIREKIFKRLREKAGPKEIAMLFNEARKIHIDEVIQPFFKKNPKGIVLLDRYADSTFVYQGLEGGVDIEVLFDLHKKYTNNYFPDLTLLLYFPLGIFDLTMKSRMSNVSNEEDRSKTVFDASSLSVHKQRQKYYMSLPKFFKEQGIKRKFVKVDASKQKTEVINECANLLKSYFNHLM